MRQRLPAVLYPAMLPTSQAAASPDNQDRFWSGAVRWRLLARAKLPIRQPRLLPIEDFQLEVRGTLPARSPCTRYRKVFQQPRYRKVFRVPSFRLCAGPTLMAWAKSAPAMRRRGRAAGASSLALLVSQFVNPLAALPNSRSLASHTVAGHAICRMLPANFLRADGTFAAFKIIERR